MRVQCVTCGGAFDDVLPDGMLYFHSCPPLSDAEVAAALNLSNDASTWTADDQAKIRAADRTRPKHRDENRPGTTHDDHGKLKAPGQGVKALST